jgi:metal-responsive CopG/Arc/MetJ family transcriptional regulator
MRTTINISENIIKEAEALYNTKNRSKAIENAIKDALRFRKLKEFMQLKSKISFDEVAVKSIRKKELTENKF